MKSKEKKDKGEEKSTLAKLQAIEKIELEPLYYKSDVSLIKTSRRYRIIPLNGRLGRSHRAISC